MSKYDEKTLKEALLELINQYRLKQGISEAQIKAAWSSLMGPSIAKHTTQVRVIRRKLYLLIDSPSLCQELFYGREKIRKMLNEELGEEYLEEVIIK
jgi:predicted nucleic acid-binding Zn ribbon protein